MEHMNILQRVEQIKAAGNYTWNSIKDTLEKEYNKTFASAEACRSWYRRQKGNNTPVDVQQSKMPVSVPRMFDPILELPGKSTLILADLHCPYHDEEFIAAAVDSAVYSFYQLEQIIVAGDLLDLDSLSRYSKSHNISRLETELEITGKMLLFLADRAPVFITQGNHEARWFDTLNAPMSFGRLISAALNGRTPKHKITTTERDYLFIGDNFIVGHLDKASSVPGKLAHGIAQKFQRHALAGHEHITGVFKGDPTARYLGASIGCCADPQKFWYSERRMNSHPFMTKGYAMIDGDRDCFSLYNGEHKQYFARVAMFDGVYNCYRSE